MKDKTLVRRILMALVGMAVAGIAVGFFKRAFFGVDPFQCLCNGINRVNSSSGVLFLFWEIWYYVIWY